LLDEDKPPALCKLPFIPGTQIGMFCTETLYEQTLARAVDMVRFSDVTVDLVVKRDDKVTLHEITKPFHPTKLEKHEPQYDCYISQMDKSPKNIFRINGLVQFISQGSTGRKTDLTFDFKSTPYPLTPNREGIKGEIRYDIQRLIQKHDVDAVSSLRSLTKPEQTTVHKSGYMLSGRRGMKPESEDPIERYIETNQISLSRFGRQNYMEDTQELHISDGTSAFVPRSFIANADSEELVRKVLELAQVALPPEPAEKRPNMLFKNLKPMSQRQRTISANALKVWIKLLELVADPDDQFGVGLSGEDLQENAERCYAEDNYFYLLNPEFLNGIESKEGKVLALWGLACHEATHHEHSIHDEYFTSKEIRIQKESADEIYGKIKELKKIL